MKRPEIHVLTDAALARGRSHVEIAAAALAGGADVIQLRDKGTSFARLVQIAGELLRLTRAAGASLVVNDHLEVANEVAADGLHLGPHDLPLAQARARFGGRLGGSARSPSRARELEAAGADYLGVGPLWGSATKPEAGEAIGVQRLSEIVSAVGIPVIAIGGIAPGNAAPAIEAGAAGIAVIAGIVGAEDPEAATRAFRREVDDAAAAC